MYLQAVHGNRESFCLYRGVASQGVPPVHIEFSFNGMCAQSSLTENIVSLYFEFPLEQKMLRFLGKL